MLMARGGCSHAWAAAATTLPTHDNPRRERVALPVRVGRALPGDTSGAAAWLVPHPRQRPLRAETDAAPRARPQRAVRHAAAAHGRCAVRPAPRLFLRFSGGGGHDGGREPQRRLARPWPLHPARHRRCRLDGLPLLRPAHHRPGGHHRPRGAAVRPGGRAALVRLLPLRRARRRRRLPLYRARLHVRLGTHHAGRARACACTCNMRAHARAPSRPSRPRILAPSHPCSPRRTSPPTAGLPTTRQPHGRPLHATTSTPYSRRSSAARSAATSRAARWSSRTSWRRPGCSSAASTRWPPC